jgi:nucleoside-diphosphate-sugar epimerase
VSESFGVRRFVFASSCSVYGESDALVDETSPTRAISLYAQTKLESENELLSVLRDDFFVTVLRFATVFGHSPRPRFDLVANLFAAQAYFDGRITVDGGAQVRPFIHAHDVARAVTRVLQAAPERVQGQIFNVGDERMNATIGEVAELARKVASAERPVEIEVRGDVEDRRNYRVAFRKIREVLGFEASRTLEDGVRELVEEFRRGRYADYRHPRYSNVEVTREQVLGFHDPMQRTRLYTPLSSVEP